MADFKEVTIKLTDDQRNQIKNAIGQDITEVKVSADRGNPLAATQLTDRANPSFGAGDLLAERSNPTVLSDRANPTALTDRANPTALTDRANPTALTDRANPTALTDRANPTALTDRATPIKI